MDLNIDGPITVTSNFGEPPEGVDVLWRAEIRRYSYVIDAEAEIYGLTDGEIELRWYRVKHRTKQGHARLEEGQLCYLGTSVTRRRWACETKAEALVSLAERRKRQIRILKGQLQQAENELALVQRTIV